MVDKKTLIDYPCDFPIKVMGETHEEFLKIIMDVVVPHDPSLTIEKIEIRTSREGKYTSLTLMIRAINQMQLDTIYRTLTSHKMVKMVF
jgi:putative lipoic acid-binding regulatory protein